MSDVQITKTFNGWLLEDKDDNLWSFSDSEVEGFIDALSELIDLQMVLSSDSPFYGSELPLQASPEQPKDTSNEDSTEALVEASEAIDPDFFTPIADLTAPKDYDLGQSVVIETDGERTHEGFNGQAQE